MSLYQGDISHLCISKSSNARVYIVFYIPLVQLTVVLCAAIDAFDISIGAIHLSLSVDICTVHISNVRWRNAKPAFRACREHFLSIDDIKVTLKTIDVLYFMIYLFDGRGQGSSVSDAASRNVLIVQTMFIGGMDLDVSEMDGHGLPFHAAVGSDEKKGSGVCVVMCMYLCVCGSVTIRDTRDTNHETNVCR